MGLASGPRRAATGRLAGWRVNYKRVQRLWRDEGLKVPYRKKKKRLTGTSVVVGAMRPIAPNVIWATDFQFDQTSDARTFTMLSVIEEFTRENLAIDVARSITADDVVRRLDQLISERSAELRQDGQRSRVRRSRHCRLVSLLEHRCILHRSRLTLAKRLNRIVQCSSS